MGKSGKIPSHLVRIGTKYHYRRIIPPGLSGRIGMREIKVTLRTSILEEARERSNRIESFVRNLFYRMGSDPSMKTDISPAEMKILVKRWLQQKVEEMENLRSLEYRDPIFHIDQSGKIRTLTWEERKQSLIAEADFEKNILIGTSKGRTSIEVTAEGMLQEFGIEIDLDSLLYKRLCRELRKGFLAFVQKEIQHLDGDYEDYEDFYKPLASSGGFEKDPDLLLSCKTGKTEKRLRDLLDTYVEYKKSENLQEKSLSEIQSKCGLFVEVLENPYPEELNIESLTRYKNLLRNLPSNARKKEKYRKKTLQQILQLSIPKKDLMDITTVNNHLVRAKSFLIWLERYGYLQGPNLPKVLQKVRESHRPFEERNAFSLEDLKLMFNSQQCRDFKHPWEFWLPLIALFSGMRINEICCLELNHIREDKGIWYFDITVSETSQPKTQSGVRKIPVHENLIDLGFLSYVKKLQRSGKKFLFPDRHGLSVSPSHYPVQRLNNWIRQAGVRADRQGGGLGKKTFHSFRHTFETRCQELGIEQRLVDQVMGHSQGKGMSARYGKPAGVSKLKEEVIDRYHFDDLELGFLKKSEYAG